MKKSILIWSIIVVVVGVVVAITTVSLAVWTRSDHNTVMVKTPIEDENTSLKYQIYVPVKSSGEDTTRETSAYERIPGTLNFDGGDYTYTLAGGNLGAIEGFALVGWYGGVAIDYLTIPEEVTVVVNNTEVTKPVVRLMWDADFADYGFAGENTVITEITVGSHVTEVDASFFSGMIYLNKVTFVAQSLEEETRYLYLREYSLGGCPNLNVVDNFRSTEEGWSTALVMLGSGVQQ